MDDAAVVFRGVGGNCCHDKSSHISPGRRAMSEGSPNTLFMSMELEACRGRSAAIGSEEMGGVPVIEDVV